MHMQCAPPFWSLFGGSSSLSKLESLDSRYVIPNQLCRSYQVETQVIKYAGKSLAHCSLYVSLFVKDDWKKKLNEPRTELRYNFCPGVKHKRLLSDLLQALQREHLRALNSQQRGSKFPHPQAPLAAVTGGDEYEMDWASRTYSSHNGTFLAARPPFAGTESEGVPVSGVGCSHSRNQADSRTGLILALKVFCKLTSRI